MGEPQDLQYIESMLQGVPGTSGGRVSAPAGRRGRGSGRGGRGRGAAPARSSSSRSRVRADQTGAVATSSQHEGVFPSGVNAYSHEPWLMAPLAAESSRICRRKLHPALHALQALHRRQAASQRPVAVVLPQQVLVLEAAAAVAAGNVSCVAAVWPAVMRAGRRTLQAFATDGRLLRLFTWHCTSCVLALCRL
jgi:hypothetical protein